MFSIPFTMDDLVIRTDACRDGNVLFLQNEFDDTPILSVVKKSEETFELNVGYSEDYPLGTYEIYYIVYFNDFDDGDWNEVYEPFLLTVTAADQCSEPIGIKGS